ncbi:MAG: response regulator, partial [Muribaculaceae bacterium]|nr:response regulator [Muribaculaceae bacterium]
EATQSKLLFYTNVSHDLRTPLTLISEPVAQLAAADNLTTQQHTLIKIADKNVRILRRLINQILDFRKYESDKLTLNLEECDLSALLSEWIDSFKALAAKRHIKLNADIAGNMGTLAADVEKMERIVFNLLSNAFKYTPDNGSITVRCHIEEKTLVLSVADTGQGIGKPDIDHIFDRFYQVDKLHPEGSGIGLTLTKAFVELHEGTIAVESTPGSGSVFTIRIPVSHINIATTPGADSSAAAVSSPRPSMTSETIDAELGSFDNDATFADNRELVLIIDDNNDIRVMLTQLLQDTYNIITARDGQEGLRKAGKHIPDLIICDVMMPGMDGLECCRRLKDEVSTSHIPVLMLTACSMDEQRVQGYDSGADGYLSKPFSTEVLKSRVTSLITNRKRIKELWKESALSTLPAGEQRPQKPKQTPKSDIDSDFYNRFIEIFNTEISNPDISVDALASRMGLERTQFYRKIKALTNFSPVELIRSLRLKHARHLLLTTDKTISEISYDCGFSSPAYFTRCYREAHTETPTETRNRMGR